MKMQRVVFVSTMLLATGFPVYAAEPIVGKWKLDLAKSKVTGDVLPKTLDVTYTEVAGGALKYVARGVNSKGEKTERSWVSKRDGKEVPFAGAPNVDSIVLTKSADGYSGSWVLKKAGKVTGQGKSTISPDGKTMTWTWTGESAEGKPTSGTTVFTRR